MKYIFTFGAGHFHPTTGENLRDRYVVLEGGKAETRERMVQLFGAKWSTQYRSEEEAGVEKYGLTELEIA